MKQLSLWLSLTLTIKPKEGCQGLSPLLFPVSYLSLTSFLHHSQNWKECGKVGGSHSPSDSMSDAFSFRKLRVPPFLPVSVSYN